MKKIFTAERLSRMIETQNLGKKYPIPKGYRELFFQPFLKKENRALENVSIRVERGEIFGLLGPNGSGKTTLLKILSTLILPTEGRAAINGLDVVTHERDIKSIIGVVVSDERSFYWRLTGEENLYFFGILNNIPKHKAKTKIKNIATLLGFEDRLDQRFQEYSSGTKQKMAIARGLLADPELLFMDEPTRSLDPAIASKIRRFTREVLVDQFKKTVFLATNNLQEAEEICDRVAIISKGKIKQCGTITEIQRVFQDKQRFVVTVAGDLHLLNSKIQRSPFSKNFIRLQQDDLCAGTVRIIVEIEFPEQNIALFIEWLVGEKIQIQSCIHQTFPLDELFMRSIHE